MRHPHQGIRTTRIATLVALLAALVPLGCGRLGTPTACAVPAECPSDSWCRSGQCVADAPPVAVIELPTVLASSRPIAFRAGGSHDPDPEDAIAGHAWTARSTGGAGCDPFPASGTEADFTVVFPCPGDHDVSLTVRDTLGLESTPASVRVSIAPTVDPPRLSAGADAAVDHRCAGTPLTCTAWDGTVDDVALVATGEAPSGVTFSWHWSVETPAELAAGPRPRVTFLPSDSVAAPRARIETSGTAISGRYVFTVTATDSRGMVATGRQQVVVGNRPPVLVGGGVVRIPHGYEPATRRFIATGETPAATWSDPDGDPVASLGFTASRTGVGDELFDVQGLGDRARITVVVPYGRPSDAAFLIGPGVSRRVELAVADPNGARASTAWDVVVTNRPPRLVAAVPAASVDHAYDATGLRYTAEAPLSTWVDDDGDPLLLGVSGDPDCGDLAERGGTAWVTCATPFTGRPGPGRLVGFHDLAVSAADPFEAGPTQATRLEIRNRPPRLLATTLPLGVACRDTLGCCERGTPKNICLLREMTWLASSATVPLVVDDDGDPLDVSTTATGGCLEASTVPPACLGAACAPVLKTCGGPSACGTWSPMGTLAVSATDGLATAAGDLPLDVLCVP